MAELRTILKWKWIRALQVWNRMPIRAQGGVTVFIPIIAVLVSFGFAIYGNLSRASREEDIERKFQAVRQYSDLLTLMIDAETGERGYILTHKPEYLEPYKKATDDIPGVIASLQQTIEAEPGEKPRQERLDGLVEIQGLVAAQLAHLQKSREFGQETVGTDALNDHLQAGKVTMDQIRTEIYSMQNREAVLLTERIEEIDFIRVRDYAIIFITLIIGMAVRVIAFYLFDRGIVRRIQRINEFVDSLINGTAARFTASKKTDAVGSLEEKVIELSQKLEGRSSLAAAYLVEQSPSRKSAG